MKQGEKEETEERQWLCLDYDSETDSDVTHGKIQEDLLTRASSDRDMICGYFGMDV